MDRWLRKLGAILPRRESALPVAPFIVGAPRSGTTLLRMMLDAHPQLAIPPETGFIPPLARLRGRGEGLRRAFFETVTGCPADAPNWPDYGLSRETFWRALQGIEPFSVRAGLRCFYRTYGERFGKQRWGDKTPPYCFHLHTVGRLLPEARFVHVIRDGRDTALSLRSLWFAPGQDIATLADSWRRHVLAARQTKPDCRRYIEVRYEDLILDTRRVLTDLCAFLDLAYAPAMEQYFERAGARIAEHQGRVRRDGGVVVTREQRLAQQARTLTPPDRTRIARWRTEMDAAEITGFQQVAGDLLEELGYPPA